MTELEKIPFACEDDFREWLKYNHDKSPGIWLVFYKKQSGIKSIDYPEALDSALCFGWIDSIIKHLDESTYARKFTPRKDTAKWSGVNKKRVEELIANGKMTKAGLMKIDSFVKTGKVTWDTTESAQEKPDDFTVPDFMLNEFAANEPALTNFNKMAKTYRRTYVLWITNAKRQDTLKSRLAETVLLLKENKKPGLR
jgi:uncharacterized protein YdeI (YjbR/CyaY-like superfamily)